MPLRKSHLYSSLWQSCDQLRGGMDASQYKDYVLTLLFMKYVSDKYAGGDGFAEITVPPGGSFADMVALKGTKEIGEGINKVIGRLVQRVDLLQPPPSAGTNSTHKSRTRSFLTQSSDERPNDWIRSLCRHAQCLPAHCISFITTHRRFCQRVEQ